MSLTISDSIAIKILNKNALLAGVGNELHLLSDDEQDTGRRVLPIKLRGKVHGIELGTGTNTGLLLVYGEKEFIVLKSTDKCKFTLLNRRQLTDWISSAKFLVDSNQFILLTAHSIALHLEYLVDAKECKILQRSSCSDKSTLYCSTVYGEQWHELVFFGGNAFGELLIWQPNQSKALLLHRISSHNGVIFSINYNAQALMLTTTSDDRSIRFWRVEHTNADWSETKLTPLASGYGHVARVFQGRIVNCSNHLYAITVGEDSYICVWRVNGELVHKCRQQFGATIWNFDYDEETKTIYTVGSTGNIISYGLQDLIDDKKRLQPTTIHAALPHSKIGGEEYISKIKFLTQTILVGITNSNRMVYKSIEAHDTDWKLVNDFNGYKCTVLAVFKRNIAICGYKRLTLYKFNADAETQHFEKYYEHDILSGLIRAFIFLSENTFVIADERGTCLLLHGAVDERAVWASEHAISLPKCKEPWPTAAVLIESQFLIISNRQGNILLYQWLKKLNKFEHTDTLHHPHGNLGATLINMVQNFDNEDTNITFFKSAGHNGSIKLLKLNKLASKLSIANRENVPIAWVEALEQQRHSAELLLGFNDNHFAIWSKRHDFVLQVPCGGGHRYWDYFIYDNSRWINLVFIKNKQVLLHTFRVFDESSNAIKLPSRNMWHVKPCNVLECIEEDVSTHETVVISAGDDNLIKISKCTRHALMQMAEAHAHISNIRALYVIKLCAQNYLIFSGGGRAQLCVTNLNTRTFLLEEMLSFTLTTQAAANRNAAQQFRFDPETRIMSLAVLQLNNNEEFHIYVGCSDGFVRLYHLQSNWEITLQTEIYYGKCILQVHLVERLFLLIAATDGKIRFSNLSLTQVYLSVTHHDSGINALDTLYDGKTGILQLVTGGDDQDVVYSRLSLRQEQTVANGAVILETLRFDHLHTAQVTAAQLSKCGRYAYSSGVDQHVFKLDLESQQIVGDYYACVADIKGLRLCGTNDDMYFLYGCGIQMCSFQN